MKCRYCGCTNERACKGGCHWIAYGVCSNPECIKKFRAEESRKE